MVDLLPVFAISFVGIYLNVWFLLVTLEKMGKQAGSGMIKAARRLPKISVLVPAHNEAESISRTLRSIFKVDYPKNKMEVIVVDNASTDNTAEIAKKFPRAKVYKIKKKGKSFALEKGFSVSKGSVIGILDADTEVSRNALKKMVAHFEDPEVGAVTNLIRVDRKRGLIEKFQHIEYAVSALSKKLLSMLDALYITPGTLSLIRREAVKKIGFSNDTLTEDMDFALSLIKKNYKIFHCLDVEVKTIIPKSLGEWARQRIRWYRGYIENMVKHRDLIFNNRHVVLGWFVLPISGLLAIGIGVFTTAALFGDYGYSVALGIANFSYLSLAEQVTLLQAFTPSVMNIVYNPYAMFLFVLVFFTSMAVVMYATKIVKGVSRRELLLVPFYMLMYYTLIMVYWFVSAMYEVFRWGKRW